MKYLWGLARKTAWIGCTIARPAGRVTLETNSRVVKIMWWALQEALMSDFLLIKLLNLWGDKDKKVPNFHGILDQYHK